MKAEKRRAPRFTVERMEGRMVSACPVEIVNMSLGGAAFQVDRSLRVGEEYALKLYLNGEAMSVKGLVVWCTLSEVAKAGAEETVPVYSAGIRFAGVLSAAAEGLLGFIDAHRIVEEHRLGGVRVYVEGEAQIDLAEAYTVRVLSRSGMLIETRRALEVGSLHPMEIGMKRGKPLRFSGRVASCFGRLESKPRHYEAGIEFHGLGRQDGARLARLIRSLAPAARPARRRGRAG